MATSTQMLEVHLARRTEKLLDLLDGGFYKAIAEGGGILYGMSVKWKDEECLITIRAVVEECPMVCFVGAVSFPECLLKASKLGEQGKLHWRDDRYAKKET
jgi:hypothetical protein